MLKAKIKTEEFNKIFKDYMKVSKKPLQDTLNKTVNDIAIQATYYTDRSTKEKISNSVDAMGNKGVSVGALIINKLRGKRGEEGLSRGKMKAAIERLKRYKNKSLQYINVGFYDVIKGLAAYVERKGKPVTGIKKYKSDKGTVQPATENKLRCLAIIEYKEVDGKDYSKFWASILKATKQAFIAKSADMIPYIEKKMKNVFKK